MACVSAVGDFASVHINSAYAIGHITGEVVAALGLVTAGAAFILLAQSNRRGIQNGGASAEQVVQANDSAVS